MSKKVALAKDVKDTKTPEVIGILGTGKVGIVLAQLALKAGYKVLIAGSGDVEKIALTVKMLAPGAVAMKKEDVAGKSDFVILALPLSKYKTIPKDQLAGKIVIDSMNHWEEVDGPRNETLPDNVSSSEFVQEYLDQSKVVKALSHMGYHELHDHAAPKGSPRRKAIAIAGNNKDATTAASKFVDSLGFDPYIIGELRDGVLLEPGNRGFGASTTKDELIKILN